MNDFLTWTPPTKGLCRRRAPRKWPLSPVPSPATHRWPQVQRISLSMDAAGAVSQWEHSADEWICQEGKKGGLGTVNLAWGSHREGSHQGVSGPQSWEAGSLENIPLLSVWEAVGEGPVVRWVQETQVWQTVTRPHKMPGSTSRPLSKVGWDWEKPWAAVVGPSWGFRDRAVTMQRDSQD